MKFGIYLSPWDRNQPCYGSGKEYDDYYIAQLTELLTGMGRYSVSGWTGPVGKVRMERSRFMTGRDIMHVYGSISQMPASASADRTSDGVEMKPAM